MQTVARATTPEARHWRGRTRMKPIQMLGVVVFAVGAVVLGFAYRTPRSISCPTR